MLTEKELQMLKGENELLLLQLEDVNAVIRQREAELDSLRATARHANELQSRLDMNLTEFEQMQYTLGSEQQRAEGYANRMQELENEMLAAVRIERKYNDIEKAHTSLQANLADTTQELNEAAGLYKKVQELKAALSVSKSSLEIAQLEIQSLRDELAEERALSRALRNSKFSG